jgi:hypothetical protein
MWNTLMWLTVIRWKVHTKRSAYNVRKNPTLKYVFCEGVLNPRCVSGKKTDLCIYAYIAPDGWTYTHSECGVRISALKLDITDLESQKTNTSRGSQMLSSDEWPWTDVSWEDARTRHVVPLVREYLRQSAQYYSTSMPQIFTLDVMLTEGKTPHAFFIECNSGGVIFNHELLGVMIKIWSNDQKDQIYVV